MRNLIQQPAYKTIDLGYPMPDSKHACSVCLPTWESVIGYEEGRPEVIDKLQIGYPRFVLNPLVKQLNQLAESELAEAGQRVLLFPTYSAALRAKDFLNTETCQIKPYQSLQALLVEEGFFSNAMSYWQHAGEIISSRQAEAILSKEDVTEVDTQLLEVTRQSIADYYRQSKDQVYLFQSGMAAWASVQRYLLKKQGNRPNLQWGFPYLDLLKLQEKLGSGVQLHEGSHISEPVGLTEAVKQGKFNAVFTEVPSNPLLQTPNLQRLASLCQFRQTPLFVDDTIASAYNVEVLPLVEAVVTSLTKWFSGEGNVLVGAVVLNPESEWTTGFKAFLAEEIPTGSNLYPKDLRVFATNLQGFKERMPVINSNAQKIAEFLNNHLLVEKVWHPSLGETSHYDSLKLKQGGYGGLLSFTLKEGAKTPAFYDGLRLCKGPSLGTKFTTVCPYTLLAHYHELDWVKSCGVSPDLIRVSVGIEPEAQLIRTFEQALTLKG